MKRTIVLLMALALAVSFTGFAYAEHDPGEKLKGGFVDIVTVPYDLVTTTYDTTVESKFYPLGFLHGLVKGLAHGVVDIATGAVNVLTFPVDTGR